VKLRNFYETQLLYALVEGPKINYIVAISFRSARKYYWNSNSLQ